MSPLISKRFWTLSRNILVESDFLMRRRDFDAQKGPMDPTLSIPPNLPGVSTITPAAIVPAVVAPPTPLPKPAPGPTGTPIVTPAKKKRKLQKAIELNQEPQYPSVPSEAKVINCCEFLLRLSIISYCELPKDQLIKYYWSRKPRLPSPKRVALFWLYRSMKIFTANSANVMRESVGVTFCQSLVVPADCGGPIQVPEEPAVPRWEAVLGPAWALISAYHNRI